MWTKGSGEFEGGNINAKNLHQLQESASNFKEESNRSIVATEEFLASVMRHLELKGGRFQMLKNATEQENRAFYEVLLPVDNCVKKTNTTKNALKSKTKFHEIPKQRCQLRE